MADNTSLAPPDEILESVKLMLGIQKDYTAFDPQLLLHINSVFTILNQLGVGPKESFIADANSTWDEFLVGDSISLDLVKADMYQRVRLLFDPPTSSFVLDSLNKQIQEYEWRLNVFVDPANGDNQNGK